MGHGDFVLYKNTERNFEVTCFVLLVAVRDKNCVSLAGFILGCEAWGIKQKKSFLRIISK